MQVPDRPAGRLLAACISPADMHDSRAAVVLLRATRRSWPFIERAWADAAYRGERVGTATTIKIEIVKGPANQRGFIVQKAPLGCGDNVRLERTQSPPRIATGLGASEPRPLSQADGLALIAIAYLQPITRAELGHVFGQAVSRDTIGHLRRLGFIAAGPRSPQAGAPYTYVTTPAFLSQFGLETLRELPDMEALEDAGLLSKDNLLADDMPVAASDEVDDEDETDDEEGEENGKLLRE